jgi:hypothetical protein
MKRKRERGWDEESQRGGRGREKGNVIKRARDEEEEERKWNRMKTARGEEEEERRVNRMKTARWVGGWLVQTRAPVMTDTNGRNIELGFCCHNKGGGW